MDGIIRNQLGILDKALYGRFLVIEQKAKSLLEYSQAGSHIFYTPHGYSHISRVEQNYDWLLSIDDLESFTKTELFCLLIATYFHDAFMIPKQPGDEARARGQHASHATHFLTANAGALSIDIHEANCVGEIIRGHHVRSLDEIPSDAVLGYDLIDQRKLAACLSIADICHADASRAPTIVSDYLKLDPESHWHWRRHMQIGGITRKQDKILVSGIAFSQDGEKAIRAYCDDIRRQLEAIRPFFQTRLSTISDVSLLLNKADSPVERPLEFKADMSKVLDLLINSVYSDKFIFLRELVQNSIDACRIRAAREERNEYTPEVICTALYEDRATAPWGVRVDDNGGGMSINDFEDTVLWLGRSISTNEEILTLLREGRLERLIGVFGIGLMSCFGVGAEIIVNSAKKGSQPFEVRIGKISERLLPSQSTDGTVGTSIIVKFHPEFKFSAKSIVDRYFWNVASPIIRVGEDVCSPNELLSRKDCFALYSHFTQIPKNIALTPTGRAEFFFENAFQTGTLFLWYDNQEPIAEEYIGDVTLLCGGIYITEVKADRVLPEALAFLSGAVDINIGEIDLSASRENFLRNQKYEAIKGYISNLAAKIVSAIVVASNAPTNADFYRGLLFEVFRRLKDGEKEFFAAVGEYKVKVASKKLISLKECLGEEVIYLYQPSGEYVHDAFVFNCEKYYKDKMDDQELTRYALEAQGYIVVEARLLKGRDLHRFKDDGIIKGYLTHNRVEVVDISSEPAAEAEVKTLPMSAKVRKILGRNVQLVDYGKAMAEVSLFANRKLYLNANSPLVKKLIGIIEASEESDQLTNVITIFRLIHSGDYDSLGDNLLRLMLRATESSRRQWT